MKTFKILFLPALLSLFMLIGCTSDEDQTARLRITLVDDYGDYDEVNVDIQGIAVHKNEHAGVKDNGWVLLEGGDVQAGRAQARSGEPVPGDEPTQSSRVSAR